MTVSPVVDSAGRRRSPAPLSGYHAGGARAHGHNASLLLAADAVAGGLRSRARGRSQSSKSEVITAPRVRLQLRGSARGLDPHYYLVASILGSISEAIAAEMHRWSRGGVRLRGVACLASVGEASLRRAYVARQVASFAVAEDRSGGAHDDDADGEEDVEHGIESVVEGVAGEDRSA
jgi:hypothetical protein